MTNTPNLPPREPLDESERTLQHALRGLPGGSPPPELDALILGAARRAAQIPAPRRDRRWIVGLSTAATAVLALGVLLKMHGLGRDAVLSSPASEQAAPAVATTTMPAAEAPASADAALSNAQPAQGRERPAEAEGQALKQAPSAFPEGIAPPPPPSPAMAPPKVLPMPVHSPAPAVITETPSLMSAPAPAAAAAASDERKEADTGLTARRDAGPPASPAPVPSQAMNQISATGGVSGAVAKDQAAKPAAAAQEAAKKAATTGELQANEPVPQRSLDKIEVAGSRAKTVEDRAADASASAGAVTGSLSHQKTVLPPLSSDVELKPTDWIVRIRARLVSGDRAGAVASLKSLLRKYPDTAIPDDLRPLLH